ncbi:MULTISPECIES: TniB family NTP-binding protein [Actinosynnema]|uniref:TniB family NTP-binding protein n=1 Tax=Actinosynnema TaxID=40566 RepID=UPI0020A36909|nr:TniB family NTP-binding protein [Actinosynnema pretiosum]MCP2098668.1 DNA transposition protein, AAA+ family ATPase [Actinosynnema pretiosum]
MTTLQAELDHVDQLAPDESLTTREGWRRFVEHQSAPPVLPTAAELTALSARARAELVQARRDYHSDLPLAHTPVIRKLLTTGRLLVQLNRGQISARRGMILSGASGTGKTTALTQLGRTHERAVRKRHPGRAGQDRIPVVYVTVPTDATPKMLAVEFARFYGVEFGSRATMPDIVNTVCAVAARTHLELVLIDEIHNILDTRARAEVSDQLKYFAERLPATFAYAGIEVEERGMFAGPRGRQIAGRFTLIDSTPFDYGTPEHKTAWRSLIATLEHSLRLHRHQPGTLVEQADYLYERTGGAIGSLSVLIRGAAVLAIEDETEQITLDLLDLIPLDHTATSTTPVRRRTTKGRR